MANRVTVQAEICKGCGLCVLVCPTKIMVIDKVRLNSRGYNPAACADPDKKCIACAMCGIMCPDSAITVEKDV